jgi:glycine/D-amino acid oxidase-like deaminating enzyme
LVGKRAQAQRSDERATRVIGRREFLRTGGALCLSSALAGCAPGLRNGPPQSPARLQSSSPVLTLPRLHASTDRITAITVCTRPFRAQGPRLDVEQVGRKTVVHNYGHGGSGWSLSWGSAALAVEKAMASGQRDMAVIGCGAIGLTSAIALQRAGAKVTIYARDLPPAAPSSRATGLWTPDSRICFESYATPEFKHLWEVMARTSYATYQSFLGLPGTPVEYIDFYGVHDSGGTQPGVPTDTSRPQFADLQRELLPDLLPRREEYAPGQHSLGAHYLSGAPVLMFNLSSYTRALIADFRGAGGEIRIQDFHAPADLARIPERTLINATGYGARALFGDESVVPVRGQLARAIPQPEVHYGLYYRHATFVPRRDGAVFQVLGESDYYGLGDATTIPDRAEAEHAVNTIAAALSRS